MTAAPDDAFLLQDYVENLETSCVFIEGKPHYVERTCAASRIAHEKYGGMNTVLPEAEVDPRLKAFVKRVFDSLPRYVQTSPYFRIDVMWDTEGERYRLAEIEGAGATRLWLEQSGRAKDYAQMLIVHATQRYDPCQEIHARNDLA